MSIVRTAMVRGLRVRSLRVRSLMVRGLGFGLCLAACLAVSLPNAASAGDAEEGAAMEATSTPLHVRDLELLPLNDLERGELAVAHPALARRLAILAERVKKLHARRAERKDPDDAGGRAIATQIEAAERELAPLIGKAVAASRRKPGTNRGIDDRLLAHLAEAPTGAQRVARYAMGLTTWVEGMPAAPAKLLTDILPRAQGALLALSAQKARVLTAATKIGVAKAQRAALSASFDAQMRRIEHRWWQLVDYVVPQAQRAAIHRALPRAYQQPETIIRHVYNLPGLRASQGVRVRALLEEVQAQAAPDNAAAKRLQREAQAPTTSDTRKVVLGRELGEAQGRLLKLQRWAVEESRRILTPAQWVALEAIPPRVSFPDRQATSPQILAGLSLTAQQKTRLAAMRDGLVSARQRYKERRLKAAAKAASYGPDSPMMAGMQMEMANIQADGNLVQRQFNGRILLELLTPEQVATWVLAPTGDR